MKLQNLLLCGLLVSSFGQGQLWAAQDPDGVVETKDPVVGKHDDFAPAVVDGEGGEGVTGGAGAGTADAVASSIPAEGPLAKLELLRGQLTGVPEECRGATLVHGAMLWEFGIVKSLYTLLITPEKNEKGQLVAGEPICSLGALLKQLFYLAGGTFSPTNRIYSFAYKLTPKILGGLYAAFMNKSIAAEASKLEEEISSWTKSNSKGKEYNKDLTLLKESLEGCSIVDARSPVNLCPSVIMAYFWAKYIMSATSNLATVRANLKAFNEAAFPAALFASPVSASASAQSPDAAEAEAIERIKTFYKYNIPKPPVQATATLLDGRSFPDCGESGLRGLFQTIFFSKEAQKFIISDDVAEGFYDDALVAFFKNFPTKDGQSTQEARNAWAEVISDRSGIVYSAMGCDMSSAFKNVMCLLAQLVPGLYKNLCASCGCSQKAVPTEVAAGGAGGDVNVVADDSLPAEIAAHFERSSDCTKKMLEVFAEHYKLFLSAYNSVDNKNAASWKLSRTKQEEAQCFLVYKTQKGHMDCQLEGVLSSAYGQFTDPILGCSDALTTLPQDPDMIAPLVFAAARMAQQQDFTSGLLALMPGLDRLLLKKIKKAISEWGLLTPEDARLSKEALLEDLVWIMQLPAPIARGLVNTCRFLCSTADIGRYRSYLPGLLFLAIQNGFLPMVKFLYEQDIDLNGRFDGHAINGFIYDSVNEHPLSFAAKKGYLPIVRYLCEEQSVDPLVFNMAWYNAANRGHLAIIKYFHEEKGADVNAVNKHGESAIIYAAYTDNNLAVIKYLCERGATALGEAFLVAARYGGFPAMQYLWKKHRAALFKAMQLKARFFPGMPQELWYKQGRAVLSEALLGAASTRDLSVVKYLCEQGASVNILSKKGETPLMFAVMSGDLSSVKYLCEQGADPHAIDKEGKTVLMYSVPVVEWSIVAAQAEESAKKQIPIIDYLCNKCGVSVNQANAAGMTALMYAARQQNVPMCKFFVGKGVAVNAVDNNGDTALMYAVKVPYGFGYFVVQELCEKLGADVNIRNNAGKTALDWVEDLKFRQIADYLRPLMAAKVKE